MFTKNYIVYTEHDPVHSTQSAVKKIVKKYITQLQDAYLQGFLNSYIFVPQTSRLTFWRTLCDNDPPAPS